MTQSDYDMLDHEVSPPPVAIPVSQRWPTIAIVAFAVGVIVYFTWFGRMFG